MPAAYSVPDFCSLSNPYHPNLLSRLLVTYKNSLFGFHLIFRVHGSAVWKASLPAVFSTLILLAYVEIWGKDIEENYLTRVTENVYTIGAFISFFSFLLTFRLNFAYARVSSSV